MGCKDGELHQGEANENAGLQAGDPEKRCRREWIEIGQRPCGVVDPRASTVAGLVMVGQRSCLPRASSVWPFWLCFPSQG